MKKQLFKIASIFILFVYITSAVGFAVDSEFKVQVYFAPHIMNDVTGEIIVDVNLRNFDVSVPDYYGDMCAVTFGFEYATDKLDIKTNEDGSIQTIVDDTTLIKNKNDIEIKNSVDGRVMVSFMDSTLESNLINKDGTLFRFTLVAKNPKGFWNSSAKYHLSFVPGSLGLVTYNTSNNMVASFSKFEAIDYLVGAYNKPPTMIAPIVDKHLTFTDGKSDVKVDDLTVETDAIPFVQDGAWMIPVRYLSENIGMSVEWDGEAMIASSYAEYKTLKIMAETNTVYINSAKHNASVAPVTINGRIYIPTDVVTALYPGSEITEGDGSVTIYIP